MSKVDVTTAIIVVVLVLALAFLGYQLYQLYLGQDPPPPNQMVGNQPTTQTVPDDMYNFPDDDEFREDTASFFDEPVASESPSSGGLFDEEPTPMGEGDYMVLAGSYLNKENAESEANRIRGLGYPSTVVEPFNRGKYHVVLVDRFASESRAMDLARELRAEHQLEAYVQKKRMRAVN